MGNGSKDHRLPRDSRWGKGAEESSGLRKAIALHSPQFDQPKNFGNAARN